MKTIPLTRGQVALVDDDDYPWLARFSWHAVPTNPGEKFVPMKAFHSRTASGKKIQIRVQMATFIMGTRSGYVAEHADRDPLNCQKSNLRWATHAQNSINWWRNRSLKNGRGVTWCSKDAVFRVHIKVGTRRIWFGRFKSAQEARDAYDAAAVKHHGKFAMLNRDHWKPSEKG